MIFSRASEYAIQAMLYLAKRSSSEGKKVIQTREIADAHGIPYHFLAKIVQDLAKADLIMSIKGPNGGIGLAHPAGEISVLEVVRSVDNIQYVTDCVVGYDKCSSDNPCPLHHDWEKIREIIFNLIRERKLADLVEHAEFVNGRLLLRNIVAAPVVAPARKLKKASK